MALAEKYFSLAVLHKFLQVKGNGLRGTEILGLIRNLDAQFLTQTEKMVCRMFGSENNGGKIGDVDPVLTKFFGPDTLNQKKLSECDVKIILFGNIRIRGLFVFRLWL